VVIRWTVVVLAVVLGVLLLVADYPLVGGPVVVFGVVRAIILVRWHRRPERHRRRHHRYSDPG
jgi:hypothetical protein